MLSIGGWGYGMKFHTLLLEIEVGGYVMFLGVNTRMGAPSGSSSKRQLAVRYTAAEEKSFPPALGADLVVCGCSPQTHETCLLECIVHGPLATPRPI